MKSQESNVWNGIVAGAMGGLIASYAMNRFQSLWTEAANELGNDEAGGQPSEGDDATVKTANAISQEVFHHELTESEKAWAGPVVHYAFGTLVGAAYGALAEAVPAATACYGAVYGSAVWLAADEIAVPASGLSQPPLETPAPAHAKALASHVVFGLTTDLARRTILAAIRKGRKQHGEGRIVGSARSEAGQGR